MLNKNFVYLAQTDTTVGFLSLSSSSLAAIKPRGEDKTFLKVVSSLEEFQAVCHTPKVHKNRVRRSHKTTFIDPKNNSCRFVGQGEHHSFLRTHEPMYSTSANPTGEAYSKQYAWDKSDVIVVDQRGLHESCPSHLIKMGKRKLKKLR